MPYEQVFNPVQFLLKVFFWFVDFLWIFFPFHQTEVALKQFHDESLENRENFLREALVMQHLEHPCIVQLLGVCQGPPLMLVRTPPLSFCWG